MLRGCSTYSCMGFQSVVFPISKPGPSGSWKGTKNDLFIFFNPVTFPICAKSRREMAWVNKKQIWGEGKGVQQHEKKKIRVCHPSTFCLNRNKMSSFTSKSCLTFPPSNCKLSFPNKKLKSSIEKMSKKKCFGISKMTHFISTFQMKCLDIKNKLTPPGDFERIQLPNSTLAYE